MFVDTASRHAQGKASFTCWQVRGTMTRYSSLTKLLSGGRDCRAFTARITEYPANGEHLLWWISLRILFQVLLQPGLFVTAVLVCGTMLQGQPSWNSEKQKFPLLLSWCPPLCCKSILLVVLILHNMASLEIVPKRDAQVKMSIPPPRPPFPSLDRQT